VTSLRLNDKADAVKYFREYREKLSASSWSPTAEASAELGTALLEAELWQEAVTELSGSLASQPRNSETIVRLARAYLGLKDLPAAGRTLESAVARGVDPAPVYALLASVYEQSGHIENAIPAMRLAIDRDPQSERYRFSYGLLLTNAFAPDAAVIRLKEALETFPQSPRLWLGLGIAHFKAGKNDEAAKALTRAIELDPKFAPPFAYLGMTYVEIGQYDQAVKSYEQALTNDPKLGVVHYLIADALQKQNTAEANAGTIERHLFRAVELEPSFAPARLSLGKHYLRNNRLTDAVEQLDRVIKLDPNLAEGYYQIARAYTKLKRQAEAQTAMATFKRLSESQKEQGLQERKEIVRKLSDVVF
jgi:Tfp pilus assembly protein PilF